ncbi:MAG: hypothetical protein JXL97_09015 [Bacteroidales bacterium]|nr:hypothetical protein [Bacteroidales bacterium]
MIVRKIKCPSCGGNKVNNISTSYIYCDYCGALMGYDIEMLHKESKEVFEVHNISRPAQKKFLQLSQELNQVLKNQDKDKFIELQLAIHETEFELYSKRFSPKIKQPSYRKKYLDYYKLYWAEKIANGYFEKQHEEQKMFQQYSVKVKTQMIGGQNITTYDTDFIAFLDIMKDFIKKSVTETLQMESAKHHPEGISNVSEDVLYKQGLGTMIQNFDEETIKKSSIHLGLTSEFVEIDDINLVETNCVVCNSIMKVPENSRAILCETCGSFNEIKNKEIKCLGCGASFNPKESEECPFCGAKILKIGNKQEQKLKNDVNKTVQEQIPKKRGFFNKLFGN